MRLPLALLPAIIVFLQATSSGPNTPAIDFPPFDPAACVARPQRLLIIDMKSGWWSGDGGEFHNLLLPRIVRDCRQIEIEYYFLQYLDPAWFRCRRFRACPRHDRIPVVLPGEARCHRTTA